ncbi:MAG: hypothetical protein RLP02_32470, partial [Coleofasciculus sp. C2-GNP5-27]
PGSQAASGTENTIAINSLVERFIYMTSSSRFVKPYHAGDTAGHEKSRPEPKNTPLRHSCAARGLR